MFGAARARSPAHSGRARCCHQPGLRRKAPDAPEAALLGTPLPKDGPATVGVLPRPMDGSFIGSKPVASRSFKRCRKLTQLRSEVAEVDRLAKELAGTQVAGPLAAFVVAIGRDHHHRDFREALLDLPQQ